MRWQGNIMTANKSFFLAILSILLRAVSGSAADPANEAPQVRLINPQDGQIFMGPTNVRLLAYAQDREDGYRIKVGFFEGTNSLGFGTFVPSVCPAPYCPNFVLTWSNVTAGAYTLTAVASDSAGASTRSDPMHIKVVELRLRSFESLREIYLARQEELRKKWRGAATDQDRELLRAQLLVLRDEWRDKALAFKEETRTRLEELKGDLSSKYRDALDAAKRDALDAAAEHKRPRNEEH